MKMNTFLLSVSIAVLLSTDVVFATDDYKYPTQVGIPKVPTFKTYTEITKELDVTKPTLEECYDLYNPVRIINDIYVELDQFEKGKKIPVTTINNLFLKWIFAQRFHFKLSDELIADSMCIVSLDNLIEAKKGAVIKGNKHLKYLKTKEKFDPKYSDIRQIVKSFNAAEELKNLDTRIDQIINHLLTFSCFESLKQSFPLTPDTLINNSETTREAAALLGVSSALKYFTQKGDKCLTDKKAMLYFRLAAKGGSIGAMCILGVLLYKKETPEAKIEAEKWLRKATKKGNTTGMSNLGILLDEKGTPEAKIEAEKWYKKAAEKGDDVAIFNLGTLLYKKGTPEALIEAEKWIKKVAEKGDDVAIFNLGFLLYEKGNFEEAEKWWREAIKKKNAESLFNLAVLLKQKNTSFSMKEAKILFTKALKAGMVNSLIPLAQLSDDPVESENYFKDAIRLNVPNALIYYADFLRKKDRVKESATYQNLYEKENDIQVEESSEPDTDSDSDLQILNPGLAVASSSSAIEAAPVASSSSSSSKLNITVEEPFIRSMPKEKYQAPIIPKKQQKMWARMEEQIKRADEKTKKAILRAQPILKTYQDIKVTAIPNARSEIKENEIIVQRLITMLANGETKRGKFEQFQDGLCSMRITKQDRLVFKITGGNLEKGITAIQIIEAKGHYKHAEARAAQTTECFDVIWGNVSI